jgi:hypothetical protein
MSSENQGFESSSTTDDLPIPCGPSNAYVIGFYTGFDHSSDSKNK